VSPVTGARDFLLSVAGEGLPSSVFPSPGRDRLIVWMAVSEGGRWTSVVLAETVASLGTNNLIN
jgi:hypothetical protein